MNMMMQYEKALLNRIKIKNGMRATEFNLCRDLFPKFKEFTTMLFNDTVNHLEFSGQIVKMNQGGVVWWEPNNS